MIKRYLIQVQPGMLKPALSTLSTIPQFSFIRTTMDYHVGLLPEEEVPRVRTISGVIRVVEDKIVGILQTPIDLEVRQVSSFQGFIQALSRKTDYWPTGESRKFIGADKAEEAGYTGKGIKVAVLDTGVDPFIIQRPGLYGESTVTGEPQPWDTNGHGVHVYTTVGGKAFPHPLGVIKGVAPDVTLIIIKVLGYGIGVGFTSDIIAGMELAASRRADIVSMSLGGEDTDDPQDPFFRGVNALVRRGIIVVIAAGNSGPNPVTIGNPGSAPDALTVGAIKKDGTIADFSSRGPTRLGLVKPDCVAPGVDILSSTTGLIATYRFVDGPKFAAISGTSMATPHVSGLLALFLQWARERGITVTTSMIKEILARGRTKNNTYGWGLITWDTLISGLS